MKNECIGIVGASGLIGAELALAFESMGVRVVRISRTLREHNQQEWRVLNKACLNDITVLINLAGESIDQRWTQSNRAKFHSSRIELAQTLHAWIKDLPLDERPSVWVNASAVGIYGDRGDEELEEFSAVGEGYLADLCSAWEIAAHQETIPGCRVIHPRIGVVLGRKSPAWVKMKKVFQSGLGGKLGPGNQWFPWVHIADVVQAIVFLANDSNAEGPYNLVASQQITNSEFTKSLGSKLSRPTLFTVPVFALRLILGDFSEALLASQKVTPKRLEAIGFQWRFDSIESALSELCEE